MSHPSKDNLWKGGFSFVEGSNQRFNSRSAEFFKRLFTHLFHRKICPASSLSTRFKRIRILDSTMFQLPSHYADTYKRFGGGARKQA
jgi:hypothetical protein